MIEQLAFTTDGRIRGKVDAAIERLRCFEPEEGYYVAFSGGKDSQCVYHLCQMAGVKFDAHYSVTSVDPPELVQFIKEHYPDAWENRKHQYLPDGKPITMWNLIPKMKTPPMRTSRYCCTELKESSGDGRMTVTGVRWAESSMRKKKQGTVLVRDVREGEKKRFEAVQAHFTAAGGVVLNDDNADTRRVVEQCYRTHKTIVNPIVDWLDEDVWEFLNNVAKVPHCCLYDEGERRLGCIGCPMSRKKDIQRDFERWPKYKAMYLQAFEKMLHERKNKGLATEKWETAEDVMEWYINSDEKPDAGG